MTTPWLDDPGDRTGRTMVSRTLDAQRWGEEALPLQQLF